MFPDHPNLLPAFLEPGRIDGNESCASRSISREGANVQVLELGRVVAETDGAYGAEGFVYQAHAELPAFDGNYPVIGSWVIGEPAGRHRHPRGHDADHPRHQPLRAAFLRVTAMDIATSPQGIGSFVAGSPPRFTVCLPCGRLPAPFSGGRSMTVEVLLVDDEVDAIELFRQSFRREIRRGEMVFRFTTSGDEALALLAESDVAERYLPSSDINMPGMTGLELLREVKRRWPSLVVIMVSAYGDADNRRRAIESGADDFVTKPVDFGHLRQALGAYVAGDGI